VTNISAAKKGLPWGTIILLFVLVGLPLLVCLGSVGVGWVMMSSGASGLATGDAVAVIYADGVIASGTEGATRITTGITPSGIEADLRRADGDPSVKAVVLRINSPGGSVVASNEIYKLLKDFKKPIVVSMGETAASGGYYISCAAKWIVANPDTLTGSIGVISELTNVDELIKKVGVQIVVIKTGPNKDIGSPFRPMTDDEKKIWQTVIDQAFDGFVQVIVQGRGLPEDKVRQIGDGRVYNGRQVDQLGYLDDAVSKAGELGGITGKPRVIEYTHTPTLMELLTGVTSRAPALSLDQLLGLDAVPRLEYRYIGP
jgi:protease-4